MNSTSSQTGAGPARRSKPVPVRRCAACGAHDAKGALLRIVRSPRAAKSNEGGPGPGERSGDWTVTVDAKGKAPGRGAYLCREAACLDAGVRKGRIEHTLKVRLSPEDKERLIQEIRLVQDSKGLGHKDQGGTKAGSGP